MTYVPYQKLSKKKRRAEDRARRGSWGGLSPVTRAAKNARRYDRKQFKKFELE